MKTLVYRNYGSPDVLTLTEVEKPIPGDTEVLIKVCAASVNPLDWHFMRGLPYPIRIMTGLLKPKVTRLGVDVAGKVEAVGKDVQRLKPGDDVFGSCRGAFAEYACTPESSLVIKPDTVTFEQAASSPIAGVTALQGLRDHGRIRPGQSVLINGAAGGVGTFAVQIAKASGTQVTGVCSTRNLDLVRSIGADRVIDYTREDFTQSRQYYDIIIDCVGNHSHSACRRILHPKGTCVSVGGATGRWMVGSLARIVADLALSPFASRKFVTFVARLSAKDLTTIAELMATGKLRPVIDKRHGLSEVSRALRYLEEGHARGKVVIALE